MARASGSYPEGRWFDSTRRYHFFWAFSSAGRASALQAEGHRFEPYNAHHCFKSKQRCGLVVQLVRMPACHAGGRRFEPVPGRQFLTSISLVDKHARWRGSTVEQLICNQQVGGSIPSASSKKSDAGNRTRKGSSVRKRVQRTLEQREVRGDRKESRRTTFAKQMYNSLRQLQKIQIIRLELYLQFIK